MKAKILVVEDNAELRSVIAAMFQNDKLQSNQYEVLEAGDAAEARDAMAGPQPDVILLDIRLPGGDGLALLPQFKKQWPGAEVILMTGAFQGQQQVDAVIAAMRAGAFHFLIKPFDPANLAVTVQRALDHKQVGEERRKLREALISTGGIRPVFQSQAMKSVVALVEKVSASDVSILITGETGTGKEVISSAIHVLSPRSNGPFVKVNCAALPRELVESELFGSVKGAFTGALADREGLFRQSKGGTLLLDEISEMPIDTQSKLLRVLQDKAVRPVGGRAVYQTDCRVIAATNRKTSEAIRTGKLREDLFHRISQITVHLPPLRERPEDILPLANAFLAFFAAQANKSITAFTPSAIERLTGFEWPGNVRQLQNEVQRAVLLCEGNLVDSPDISVATVNRAASKQQSINQRWCGVEQPAV